MHVAKGTWYSIEGGGGVPYGFIIVPVYKAIFFQICFWIWFAGKDSY